MRKNTKLYRAHRGIQANFGTETGFRFARLARGCITHGQLFRKGDPHVEMDEKTFKSLEDAGLIAESSQAGCFYLKVE
tara:strand:- start:303 stop:536 length:234 start_codon:yes stop_codon:yes gene_type:complete